VWTSKLDDDIAEFEPDLIGVTCMFTMTHTSFRDVCRRAASSGIPLAIGGVHVTNDGVHLTDIRVMTSLAPVDLSARPDYYEPLCRSVVTDSAYAYLQVNEDTKSKRATPSAR
jgi:hypothetical protein